MDPVIKILSMRAAFLFICSICLINAGFAQMPGGPAFPSPSATGRLYGRIVEGSTNKGLEAASVQLIQTAFDSATQTTKEIVVDGMLTQRNGDFSLEKVPARAQGLKLIATAIGFTTHEQKIELKGQRGAIDKDMGNIKLQVDPKLLQGVTVTASKPMMSLGIDRKVFNVEKNIV